ncbi:ribonuclease P protein component [Georgenia alba]|uniref:Ribonuclease P protein component n=1 Tax=Georgenia alba TaxID=2233858 RepID=A0ABW2Q346_9MICO
MRRSVDFTDAVRRGARGGARRLVVHLTRRTSTATPTGDRDPDQDPVLVGFVVPRAVGGAVTRNTVKRRLRALMADRVGELDPGQRAVVRALPPAAGATSAELAKDLDAALATARRRNRPASGARR